MSENFFGGFQALASHISNSEPDVTKVENSRVDDPVIPNKEEEENGPVVGEDIDIDQIDRSFKPNNPNIEEEEDDILEGIDNEEEEEEDEFGDNEPDPIKPSKKEKKEEKPVEEDGEVSDLGEIEEDITEYVQERLFQGLGIGMSDDTKFESMDDVMEFMFNFIEENSVPEFASQTVADIDNYVRNGGDLKHYMDTVHGGVNPEALDLTNVEDQKRIVAEDLRLQGISEARILRKIERMEDAGTLEEEAQDSKESVDEYKEKNKQKLLEDQRKAKDDAIRQQQRYITDVETTINDIDNIRGVTLTSAEKKQLLNYIFKPVDENGQTQYQKDYISNNKNLVESAYFTMKGDSLINKVEKKANSNAAKKLKTKLANKGKRGKNQNTQTTTSSNSNVWSIASQQLRNKRF